MNDEFKLNREPSTSSQDVFLVSCNSVDVVCDADETFAPEGRSIIAQQFTAGEMGRIGGVSSPGGTIEVISHGQISTVPPGRNNLYPPSFPAINRWAIFNRPSGSKSLPTVHPRQHFAITHDSRATLHWFILHPSSFILHHSSFIIHHSSFTFLASNVPTTSATDVAPSSAKAAGRVSRISVDTFGL